MDPNLRLPVHYVAEHAGRDALEIACSPIAGDGTRYVPFQDPIRLYCALRLARPESVRMGDALWGAVLVGLHPKYGFDRAFLEHVRPGGGMTAPFDGLLLSLHAVTPGLFLELAHSIIDPNGTANKRTTIARVLLQVESVQANGMAVTVLDEKQVTLGLKYSGKSYPSATHDGTPVSPAENRARPFPAGPEPRRSRR